MCIVGEVQLFIEELETKMIENLFNESFVGQITGNNKTDFYVYEWFVVETGEIFYIGKGRGNRYKAYHSRAYEAERIRAMYNTDIRFVAKNLTEEESVRLETKEMLRVLNETQDILTNRIVPIFAKRRNGYNPSANCPKLQFLKTPVFWTCEIDEHYFGVKTRGFDVIDISNLKKVYFIEKKVLPDAKMRQVPRLSETTVLKEGKGSLFNFFHQK